MTTSLAAEKLYNTILRLRAPDGCPWDKEQTAKSLRGDFLEEVYEALEAINEDDAVHVKEELGDSMFVAMMIASTYEEKGLFKLSEVFDETADKLIRRHPHVFGDVKVSNSHDVVIQWNKIKEEQEGRAKKDSVLDKVKKAFPPLELAYKTQKAAAKVGFDWPNDTGAFLKLTEEVNEVKEASEKVKECANDKTKAALEDEIGDLLFSVVNVARKNKIDPSLAMSRAIDKFSRRFRYVEKAMKDANIEMEDGKLEIMDKFWDEAKEKERNN